MVWRLVGAAGLALGCAQAPVALPPDEAVVSGTLVSSDGSDIPPGSRVEVTLADVSRMDAPAVVIARQTLTEVQPQPLRFALPYQAAEIQAKHSYVVSARVTDAAGQLRYINTSVFPVLTGGAGGKVDLVVDPVRRPAGF